MKEKDEKRRKWKIIKKCESGLYISSPATILIILTAVFLAGDGMVEFSAGITALLFVIFWFICLAGGTWYLCEEYRQDSEQRIGFLWIILFVEMIAFILLTKPWFQGIAMFMYLNIWIIEALVLSIVFAVITIYLFRRTNSKELAAIVVFIISIIALLVMFGLMNGTYVNCYLAETLSVEEIDELPAINEDFVRIMPMKVGDRYASDACQFPKYRPKTPPDITMIKNNPYWTYVLVPDGLFNEYGIKSAGIVLIDMSTTKKNVTIKEISFKYAPDQQIEDDIYWQIYSRNYWINCERVMAICCQNNNSEEYYLATPYISYETKFTFPIWYRVPKWGGVFLVDPEGNIEDLSPSQARNHPALKGQKIFPEKLVLEYVNSQKYWKAKDSWWDATMNVWFSHDEEIEVTDISGQGNKQPFLLNTVEGFKWTVSTEPWGEAHGIYRIYLIDGRDENADIQVKKYGSGQEIGPVKACDYIRKKNPMVDWSLFEPIEPIPVTPNGKLYWEVRVVPSDGSGVSYVAFVDPQRDEVYELETTEEIKAFISQEEFIYQEPTEPQGEIYGEVVDLYTYVRDGNTRWLITISEESQNETLDYIVICARVEDFNATTIKLISDLELEDQITVEIEGANVLKEIKKGG